MAINLDHVTQQLTVTDTAANADLTFVPKGTGAVKATNATNMIVQSIGSSGFGSFLAQGSTGNAAYYFGYVGSSEVGRITMTGNTDFGTSSAATLQLRVAHTASAVNYVQVTGAATGGVPAISMQGSDANITMRLQYKGNGGIQLSNAAGWAGLTVVTANNPNYFSMTGNASGTAPVLAAIGVDTNIDLSLTPKGTGNVRFGTHTGTADTAVSGYIEIKDSGGTVRKLAVIT